MLFLIVQCEMYFLFSFTAENGVVFVFIYFSAEKVNLFSGSFLFYGRKSKIHFRSASTSVWYCDIHTY